MDELEEFKTEFENKDVELTYWKDQAQKLKKLVIDSQNELTEFQEFSRALEQELQTELEENEKKINQLNRKNVRITQEYDTIKEKLEQLQEKHHREINKLQDELAEVTALKDEQGQYIREIEQCNDDLERTKRATIVSIEDFELRLQQAIERNALLESELDEKEVLAVTVQRLRDEARDLSQELTLHQRKANEAVGKVQNHDVTPTQSPRVLSRSNSQSSTPAREYNGVNGGTPLTPSARISALNIVGELLRKVGALESKLASCRNFVREKPGSRSTLLDSPVWEKNIENTNNSLKTLTTGTPLSKIQV